MPGCLSWNVCQLLPSADTPGSQVFRPRLGPTPLTLRLSGLPTAPVAFLCIQLADDTLWDFLASIIIWVLYTLFKNLFVGSFFLGNSDMGKGFLFFVFYSSIFSTQMETTQRQRFCVSLTVTSLESRTVLALSRYSIYRSCMSSCILDEYMMTYKIFAGCPYHPEYVLTEAHTLLPPASPWYKLLVHSPL